MFFFFNSPLSRLCPCGLETFLKKKKQNQTGEHRASPKQVFLAIFRNEITTILTFSTSEGGGGVVAFFVLEVPDYKSAMLIYLYSYV